MIFTLELFYLAALLTAAATFIDGIYSLPGNLGTLPLAVPWFGALGGVCISMTGTASHPRDWDTSLAFWHISRPLMGASVAVIAVLIMQAGLTAVGSAPSPSGSVGTPSAPHNVLYYVVAFVVGYREATFRALLKRVVDVILTPPPEAPASPAVLTLDPPSGPASGGTTVVIRGSGLASAHSVRFGDKNAELTAVSDMQITVISPAASGTGAVAVTISTNAGSLNAPSFTYA